MAPRVVSPGSSINKTADELGPAPKEMQPMGPRLIDYGGGPDAPKGRIDLALRQYSTPIYKYDEVSQQWVYWFPTAWALGRGSNGNVAPGAQVPDNLNWKGGEGNDGMMMVERDSTGEMWGFWMVHQPAYNCIDFFNFPGPTWQNIGAGLLWKNPTHCGAAAGRYTNVYEPVSDKDDFERGNGMKQRALMTTIDDLLSGEIKHAIQLTITNSWFSEGPANLGKAGTDYLYPARRCEFDRARSVPTRDGHPFTTDKNKLTLHGTRIRFKLTAAERKEWLDRNIGRTKTPFREFCRIVLNAICDYGFVTTDSGGWGMLSQFDGIIGPAGPVYAKEFGIETGTTKAKIDKFNKQCAVFAGFAMEYRDRVEVVAPAP